jgi:Arc/MetJ family transcription regulator
MRTNIEIDDKLMKQALALSPKSTKKAVVEEALLLTVKLHRQRVEFEKLRGIGWDGDLAAMREQRFPDWDKASGKQPENSEAPAA